jgi:hypothetical protein
MNAGMHLEQWNLLIENCGIKHYKLALIAGYTLQSGINVWACWKVGGVMSHGFF